MFPVRFPSMICQRNMSWGRQHYSERPLNPPFFPTPFLPLTICNWRLGLPAFCKMAATGRETSKGALRLKEST